jgi:all-trans-retinol dehydrogenase (NAD+)
MADLFDENIEYHKSDKTEPTKFLTNLTLFGKLFIFVHKIEFMCIIEIFRGIWRIFVPKSKKNIEGQVVLITGGGNGIGKQLAIEFAKEKCNIAIVDIDINAAKQLEEELVKDFNIKAKAFKVDVSKVKEVENLKLLVEDSLGSVDILVNNAGILTTTISLFEGAHEHIQKIIDVNMTSHLWVNH